MQEQISNSRSELWNLSFRDLFYKYVRFLPLFVLSVAFALLGAYAYLRYAIPVYGVGGTMMIRSDQDGNKNDKFEEMFVSNKTMNIQSEMEILRSRPLMQRVVDSLHLQWSYFARGKIKTVNIYKQGPFLVDPLKINDSSSAFSIKVKFINDNEFRINNDKTVFSFGQVFQNVSGVFRLIRNPISGISKDYTVFWTPTKSAAAGYAGAIQVVPKIAGTGILIISMRTPNSQMGADILNSLMEEYGKYTIKQKELTSDQTLAFINKELDDYKFKIDSVEGLLDKYKREQNIVDVKAQLGNYMSEISAADKTIVEQTVLLNSAGMVTDYLKDKKNEFIKVVVPSSLGLDDPTLNGLVEEYNKAQIARQQLLDANVPPDNPSVQEAGGQIEKLRVSILENLKNIKSSISSVINSVSRQNEQDKSQLSTLPYKEKEQLKIERQLDASLAMYKLLQEERERTAISRAATISNSGVIDSAIATTVPVKPNKRTIQILAILLGLGLPGLFIFIGEVLNDKVSTRFDIEKITTTPILGEIGHSYSNQVLVVNKTTRSMVAEQFRIIRSNLQFILGKSEKSVILVTSSFSGEGKSYITTNMGAVLALAGKKTVVLEFDIRKPKILTGLGIHKGPGITNFLVGKAAIEDLIKPVPEQENLFVLGCGPIPPNPAELLLDPKVEELFTWLKNNFDIVLVDTAPVGMVSDAMTLSKFADSTLYLVRQGHTFKKQIALIDEFYIGNKLPKISIVINDVKIKPGYGYYGYGRYGYGYGYGYGSYYEEETPPKNLFEKILSRLDIRKAFRGSKRK